MKRICAALLCLAALFLAACGGEEEKAGKEHCYEALDSTGTVLYTVKDGGMIDVLDDLLGGFLEDMEPSGAAGDVVPLYTYVYCQEKALLAGEGPDKERDYEELMYVLVPAEGETLAIQVLPGVEALDWLAGAVGLESLTASVVTVSPETAETLRDPGQFAE